MIADLKPYVEYKESGLPWLGQVPGHWDVQKPRHIGSLLKGGGGTKEDALSAGVPCVRYGELYTTHTFFVRKPKAFIHPNRASNYTPLQYGDVLFAASGETLEEIGKSAVNLIEGAAVCGGDVIILRPTVPVHAPFLGYVMDCRPSANQKATMGRGTTVKHIYPDELKNLLFPVPPVPEQAAIVRFLDWANGRLERAIRAKRKVIALLNEQKQAIIHRAVTRGLDPSVPLKPSGIPWLSDIPQHWEVRRVASFAYKVTNGWVGPTRDILTDPGVPYLQSLHVKGGEIRFKKQYFVSEVWLRKHDKIRLRAGDVVVVQTGDVGQVAHVPPKFDGAGCHALIIIGTKLSVVSGSYLSTVLNCWYGKLALKLIETGALLPHLNCGYVRDVQVPVPPLREQAAIEGQLASVLAPISAAISRLEREIELLREYRTRFVADVVTGKLDVRDAAARLPDDLVPDTSKEDVIEAVDVVAEEAEA